MDDGPEWFAPKRYGYGSGLPISWQGWLITFAFVAVTFVVVSTWAERPLQLFGAMVPLTTAFFVICARTTRGGWRWRWGEDD